MHKRKPVAPDLLSLNGEKVAAPQPGAEGNLNPRGQKDVVPTMPRTSRHLRGYRKETGHLLPAPGTDWRKRVLDGADRPGEGSDESLFYGMPDECVDHATVLVDCDGFELAKGRCEVAIDIIHGQRLHMPRQAASQNRHLVGVACFDTLGQAVLGGEVEYGRHVLPSECGIFPRNSGLCARGSIGHGIARPLITRIIRICFWLTVAGASLREIDLIFLGVWGGHVLRMVRDGWFSFSKKVYA